MSKENKCQMCGKESKVLMMDDLDKFQVLKCDDCRKKHELGKNTK